MPATIRCVSLRRHFHGLARLDLWHAEEKSVYWVEIHLGPRRLMKSEGHAQIETAQEEFARQLESLPEWYAEIMGTGDATEEE